MKNLTFSFKKFYALTACILFFAAMAVAQNPAYRINSTLGGFVAPVMSQAQRTALSNVAGNLVYQIDGTAGYYYNDGTNWKMLNNLADASGLLSVANGGTGTTSLTLNGVLYGNGTGAVNTTAASTAANQVLATSSAGGAPSFQSMGGGVMILYSGPINAFSQSTVAPYTVSYTGGYTSFNFNPTTAYYVGNFLTLTESQAQVKMPKCVITRIRVYTGFGAHSTTSPVPVTVRKNAAPTPLVVNVAAASPANTYYEASSTGVAFADGDLLSVQATWAVGGFGLNRIEITYYLLP